MVEVQGQEAATGPGAGGDPAGRTRGVPATAWESWGWSDAVQPGERQKLGRMLSGGTLTLSTAQSSPVHLRTTGRIVIPEGGNLIKVHLPPMPRRGGGVRCEVHEFSRRARRNLECMINSINRSRVKAGELKFVTLTYPAEFPSARAAKVHLDTLGKRFRRAYGPHWAIWKLEPQERGAPHFHLLLWVPGVATADLLAWMARAWNEVAGEGDPMHLKVHLGELGNRPCVESVNDFDGVGRYASKYLYKLASGKEEWQHPGRYWGQWARQLAPIDVREEEVSERVAEMGRRAVRRYYESQPGRMFHLSGIKTCKGNHLPGRNLDGSMFVEVGGRRRRLRDCWQEYGESLGRQIRPIKRRWKSAVGGVTCFMSAGSGEKLKAWAKSMRFAVVKESSKCNDYDNPISCDDISVRLDGLRLPVFAPDLSGCGAPRKPLYGECPPGGVTG